MATTPRSDVLNAARSALAHMERLGESGWCLCVSASAPIEVEDALRDLIKLVEAEHPEPEITDERPFMVDDAIVARARMALEADTRQTIIPRSVPQQQLAASLAELLDALAADESGRKR